jgi:hypothetical protein
MTANNKHLIRARWKENHEHDVPFVVSLCLRKIAFYKTCL